MKEEQFQISQAQSKIFARVIYTDISVYVREHQKEYQEFLKQEEISDVKENQGTY